jgi:hypothetical protein
VDSKKTVELRTAQIFVSTLVALAIGLCAPSLPLALASISASPQDANFVLQKSPLLLRAKPSGEMPDIEPTQALDYWASLREGEIITLPVRRGNDGLWWQFDSGVLSEKLDAFYDGQGRRK